MALKLYESDTPRTFQSKFTEYVQKPAWPSLRFLKDQVQVRDQPEGTRIEFAVRSGLPVPLIYAIYVEALGSSQSEKTYDYEHIGPFSTDDWVLEIREWEPERVEVRVGLEPFEVQTDSIEVVL